jgi:Tfp pilus assembly protein PilN
MGVTLASIRQQGMALGVTGTSQSNARVSAYLQELDRNELFLNPQLGFVRLATKPTDATETYQFSINVTLRPANSGDLEAEFDDPSEQGGTQ